MNYNTQLPKSTRRSLQNEKWEFHKKEIYGVYIKENITLHTTMSMIEKKHGFVASKRKWKLKLKEWKFSKYTTKKLMKAAEMTSSRDEKHTARSENLTRSAKVPETDSYLFQITRNVIAEAGNKPSVKSLDRLILLDRELFNNFCTKTCYTVQSDAVQQSVWRINVPQLAFSFDFVMHGILALSALHLAYLYPQKDFYVSHAQMHHQISLHKGRKLLPHITQENCSGLYIFSALVALYTLASPRKPEDFLLVGETGIAPWLLMFRGSRSIVDSSEAALMSGPLGPMYQNGLRRFQLRESCTNKTSTGEEQLTVLRNLIAETILDPTTFGIYAHAIEELRKSFAAFNRYQYNHGTTDAFIWVDRVSGEYLLRLGNKTQESLCIFAFFCVLLHQMNSVWWGEGWSTHLMTQIDLLLNEEHRRWIWWPVKQVHGLPDQPAAAQAL